MRRLLQLARERADSVEILTRKTRQLPVIMQDRRIESVVFNDSFNVSLRIIRGGRLGTSYGNSLERKDTLIDQAVESSNYGDAVEFDFSDEPIPEMDFANYDENISRMSLEKVVADTAALVDHLKASGVDNTIQTETVLTTDETSFLNSRGVEGKARTSRMQNWVMALLPASGVGPVAAHRSHTYFRLPEDKKTRIVAEYRDGLKRVSVPTRRMGLLVTPHAWHMIKWRIEKAVSAKSLVERITPLEGKEGERVIDERVSIVDHPHRRGFPRTAAFDDEGVPTRVFTVFDHGVFQGFICDLKYGRKLGRRSTGHGWKTTMWGGDIGTPIQPALQHLMFKPGDTSLGDMMERMDEGIVLHFPNSPHSGNIPQGDFSVNIGLGYYVKNGKVEGRVEDCMVAGNIYELFGNLEALSAELEDESIPYLLFKDVSVAGTGEA